MAPHRVKSEQEARSFEYFGEVSIRNRILSLEIIGYPPGEPLNAQLRLPGPTEFIYYDLSYRHICRNVVTEFAQKLQSTMAIYFYDYGDIDVLYSNGFKIYEYGEESTKPIQEFLESIQTLAQPLDWDIDYSQMGEAFAHTAYFVDKFR